MPTPEIFDFDADALEGYDADRAARVLAEHPTVYVNHLHIARHLAAAAAELEQGAAGSDAQDDAQHDAQYDAGYLAALRAVAAYLRQGDYVPDGPLLQPPSEQESGGAQLRFKTR